MMRTVKGLIVITVSLLFALSCTTNDDQQKPNVILVFIDDMGWADFSCFGNKDAATPNIDRLAAQGIAFEKFLVALAPIGNRVDMHTQSQSDIFL